ncbi:MAG: hypothetical protein K1X75_08355 [Leptospirales bacterium]|nr:hypothetical protein [Leptospirales bacterium]
MSLKDRLAAAALILVALAGCGGDPRRCDKQTDLQAACLLGYIDLARSCGGSASPGAPLCSGAQPNVNVAAACLLLAPDDCE